MTFQDLHRQRIPQSNQ